MKKNTGTYIILFSVAIIWGTGFLTSEYALTTGWSVFSILFERNFLSFIVTFLIAFKSKFWKDKKLIKVGIIAGLIYFAGYAFQLTGQQFTTVSNTGLITSFGVILVPYFYWLFFKKKPQLYSFIGCFIGLFGTLILSYDAEIGFQFHIGDILVFISAIIYAIHLTYVGKEADDFNFFGFTSVQFITMAICSLFGIIITGSEFFGPAIGWHGVLPYALLSGAFGVCGQLYCQRQIKSYKVSLVLTLEGLFAALFAILFKVESFTWQVAVGGTIMLGSVFFVQIMDIKNNKLNISKEV